MRCKWPSLAAVLFWSAAAQAHRLDGQVFLLPDGKVQVEAWFSSGEPARGARMEAFQADQKPIAEGLLDEHGVYRFSCPRGVGLTVILTASGGHRKELKVTPGDWPRQANAASDHASSAPEDDTPPMPLSRPDMATPIKEALLGITFLVALAAFWLSSRNARRLKELERKPVNRWNRIATD